MKSFIEKKTHTLFGTYHWRTEIDSNNGPPPVIGFVLRPPNQGWVRMEFMFLGRAFYLTWGYQA